MDSLFENDGSYAGETVMIKTKIEYIHQLKLLLEDHPDRDEIIHEIACHTDELLQECDLPEYEAISLVQRQIGTPEKLASQFRYVSSKEAWNVKKMFIIINALFFAVGGLLAFGAKISVHLHTIWELLAQSCWIVLFVYSGYWVFIGFEIGKEYGAKGKGLLERTIRAAIIPNIILMLITLIGILPSELFQSFLSSSFLIGCLAATFFFFPISKVGYYMGVRKVFD